MSILRAGVCTLRWCLYIASVYTSPVSAICLTPFRFFPLIQIRFAAMATQRQTFGQLKCITVDELPAGRQPEKVVVLCHGFGASGDDLAGFGPALLAVQEIARTCRFVFPEAPLDLTAMGMPGGKAWWEINMSRLAEMHQTNDFKQLAQTEPEGLSDATKLLAECIREIQQDCQLDDAATVVGGFSQGAMISTDLVLRHGFQPKAMALFSGTIVCQAAWEQAVKSATGCAVLMSHGYEDTVLPHSQAVALKGMLEEGAFDVQFESFHGGHTIPMNVLTEFAKLLTR